MTIEPTARLVLACMREHPDQDTSHAMAEGALAPVVGRDAVQAALVELRAAGMAREASGHWRLTGLGQQVRADGSGPDGRCRVTRESRGTVVSVTAVGAVTNDGADALRDELRAADEDDPEIVLLDLSAALDISAAGVEAIAEADGRGRRGGARLVVMPGPERVQAAIAQAGLGDRLTFVSKSAIPA